MIVVSISADPKLSATEKRIANLPNKLAGLRELMQNKIAPEMNAMLKRHWDSKGAAFGHPWAPWAHSTLLKRLRKGNAAKGILRDTDHLMQTIFQPRLTDNRLRRSADGEIRLSFNTRVPYAIFHQVGTSFMPERQVFPDPVPQSFKQRAREIIRGYLAS